MSNIQSRTFKIHPHFKTILLIVTGLTLLCFFSMLVLSFINPDAKTMAEIPVLQNKMSAICNFGWQAGFGAIIGLIGGNLSSQ